MDLKNLATQLLVNKLGASQNESVAESALDQLIGEGDKFDVAGMLTKFTGSGSDIAAKAKSWLGDSQNDAISESEIEDAIGSDKIGEFAAKLGIGQDEAKRSLADILPQLIDKGSRGGSLLDSVGGLGGIASKFFK